MGGPSNRCPGGQVKPARVLNEWDLANCCGKMSLSRANSTVLGWNPLFSVGLADPRLARRSSTSGHPPGSMTLGILKKETWSRPPRLEQPATQQESTIFHSFVLLALAWAQPALQGNRLLGPPTRLNTSAHNLYTASGSRNTVKPPNNNVHWGRPAWPLLRGCSSWGVL